MVNFMHATRVWQLPQTEQETRQHREYVQFSKPPAQPSVEDTEKGEDLKGPRKSRVIREGDRSVTWSKNRYCQNEFLLR